MSWLYVSAVTVPFAALMLWIAHELGVMLAEARETEDKAAVGECHCTRHRICAVCLAAMRKEAA